MLAVEGRYDGQCVRLNEKVDGKQNQRVIVVFDNVTLDKNGADTDGNDEEKDAFMDALLTDKYVSPVTTNYDVDAFIRESRGYE